MTVKEVTPEFIAKWCKANGKVDWYKAEANKIVDHYIYPRVANAEGKKVADKSQAPKVEKRAVTFLQFKNTFIETFGAEVGIKRKTAAKSNFRNLIDNI